MKQELKKAGFPFGCVFLLLACDKMAEAQKTSKDLDTKAIKSMAGCYEVEFKYSETFSYKEGYEKKPNYITSGLEWVEVVVETGDKIVLQHLLIINDSMTLKHWRQDWVYASSDEFQYDKDNQWSFHPLEKKKVKDKWTQKVYQVDDGPRYSGTATWTHVDGISSWYSKASCPLPRREYTKRNDYNVMQRANRISIMNGKWLHEQDNDKIVRTDTSDVLLVQEKGLNTYTKRPDADCKMAQDWWQQRSKMWKNVRDAWDEVYMEHKTLKLQTKLNGKRLYQHLFHGRTDWTKSEVKNLVNQYIIVPQ